MKMGPSTTKKADRAERKKKKLTALLEITKLNDKDRIKESSNLNIQDDKLMKPAEEKEDGEIEDSGLVGDGPCRKRYKTNDGHVSSLSRTHNKGEEKTGGNASLKPYDMPADELMLLKKELKERKNRWKGGNFVESYVEPYGLAYEHWYYTKKKLFYPPPHKSGFASLFNDVIPRVMLNEMGDKAHLLRDYRTPIFMSDIQHLIMYSQLGNLSPVRPRWCVMEKANRVSHTVVLVVEGATIYDFLSSETTCPTMSGFGLKVEVISPLNYDGSLVEELAAVPLSTSQKFLLEEEYGSLMQAEQYSGLVFRILRSIFPIQMPDPNEKKETRLPDSPDRILPVTDRFPRTDLLLSAWQMIEEGYPIPLKGELKDRYSNYAMSKDEYTEVTPKSPMWGLDCEMCLTCVNKNELTRVSIVDESYKVMYDSLVKPPNKIVDYLTQYSGITEELMKDVTKTLEEVQEDLRQLLPTDVILVGQSLNGDLHALKLMHPYVIDTSVIYNLTGTRPRKTKLAILSSMFLGEQIQKGHGHDSVEDSAASLKLVQLKLAHSIEFGDAVLGGPINYSPFKRNRKPKWVRPSMKEKWENILATSLFSHVTRQKKIALAIGQKEVLSNYETFVLAPAFDTKDAEKRVTCLAVDDNRMAIQKTCYNAIANNFCITHVRLADGETISQVDQWTAEIMESLAMNAFFIIVLAGAQDSMAEGACFMTIKNPLKRAGRPPHAKFPPTGAAAVL